MSGVQNQTELVCRICLSILRDEFLDISSSYFEDKTLRELMELVSETPIELRENLPPNVCLVCSEKLCKFYELRNQIQRNETNLRQKCLTLVQLGTKTMFCFTDTSLDIDKLMVVADTQEPAADAEEAAQEVKLEKADPLDAENVFYLKHNIDLDEEEGGVFGGEVVEEEVEVKPIELTQEEFQDSIERLVFSCDQCDDKFATNHKLKNHISIVHSGEKPKFSCEQCSRPFNSIYSLRHHKIRMHTTERPYACDCCDKTFAIAFELRKHVKLKHGNIDEATKQSLMRKHKFIYKCPYCEKMFNSVTLLQRHKSKKHQYVTSLEPHTWHTCDVCQRKFSKRTYLNQHMKMHSGLVYQCDECDKTCRLRSQLVMHKKKIHFQERPHVCETCGKGFATSYELRKHGTAHTNEKPYMCEICSKQFRIQESLIVHRRVHTQKMIPCEVCGKHIKERYLPKHMQLHDENSLYKCEICDKEFKQNHCLYEHRRIKHLGIERKSTKCEICGSVFVTNATYLRHKRIVHMGMKFQCTICDIAYSEKNRATNHVKRVHPESVDDKDVIVYVQLGETINVAKEEQVSDTESLT